MSRKPNPEVTIDDIQIRLYTKVEDVVFVTSWYGPKDTMRFAAIRYTPRALSKEEIEILSSKACVYFSKKINHLNQLLSPEMKEAIVVPSRTDEETDDKVADI